MAATELQIENRKAFVLDGELILDSFRETDPDVVAFVEAADDSEEAVHTCLAMGARALRLAAATLDGQLVAHGFGEMSSALERSVEELARRVDASARERSSTTPPAVPDEGVRRLVELCRVGE